MTFLQEVADFLGLLLRVLGMLLHSAKLELYGTGAPTGDGLERSGGDWETSVLVPLGIWIIELLGCEHCGAEV